MIRNIVAIAMIFFAALPAAASAETTTLYSGLLVPGFGQPIPILPVGGTQETPDVPATDPMGEPVTSIVVRDDADGLRVCVDVGTQNVACILRSLLGPADELLERGSTPIGVVPGQPGQEILDVPLPPAGFFGQTPEIAFLADVSYTYDSTAFVWCAVGALDDTVCADLPAPTDWWADNGMAAVLSISLQPVVDGEAQGDPIAVSVPFVGQVLGFTGASLPFESTAPGAWDFIGQTAMTRSPTCTGVIYTCSSNDEGFDDDAEDSALLGLGIQFHAAFVIVTL